MDIYKKIDQLFNDNQNKILEEILKELKEIKNILLHKEYKKSSFENNQVNDKNFKIFVVQLKKRLKENERKNISVSLEFENIKLGVNKEGLLYDKNTNRILTFKEADSIFKKLYKEYKIVEKVEGIFND